MLLLEAPNDVIWEDVDGDDVIRRRMVVVINRLPNILEIF